MSPRKAILSLAVLLLASAPLALAQGTYTQIDYPGGSMTRALGIDNAGDIVGFYFAGTYHGFLLSGGTYTTIDYRGESTYLNGINDVGQIVGYGYSLAFVYNLQTQIFTEVAYPGTHNGTDPTSINHAGTIAGSYAYHAGGAYFGFQLAGSTYSKIVPPGSTNAIVSGISGSGKFVGSALNMSTGSYFNFSYAQGKYQNLRIPNTHFAAVNGISPSGSALVGQYMLSLGVAVGFVYENKTLQTLQFPGAIDTYAYGVNDAGEVVGWFIDSSYNTHGFTWTPPADAGKK